MALKNSQYDIITRAYNQKQLRNRYNQTKRQEEIYEKIPRIHEIDDSIATISVKRAKELLSGNEFALSHLKHELEELAEEKRLLLLRSGFPEHYLETQYDCPDCKDTGYINGKKCHCFKQASIDLLYTQSNLREILKTENFGSFTLKYYDNKEINSITGKTQMINMTEIHDVCRSFVARFDREFENLFFYGDTGVGKTFLSHCIAKELMDAGFSVIYYSAPNFFNVLAQGTFHKEDADAQNTYDYTFDCDLLIIDDLGTEFTNSFIASQLFICINERLLNKKSTVISTNLSLDSLADLYTERSFSRITSNYVMLKLVGDDIRIKKKLMNREEV